MKRIIITLCVLAALAASACAMEAPVILPESVTECGNGRLEKVYRLGPEDDPAEIPTEDFEQDGRGPGRKKTVPTPSCIRRRSRCTVTPIILARF